MRVANVLVCHIYVVVLVVKLVRTGDAGGQRAGVSPRAVAAGARRVRAHARAL
jgi:hypothetical protein